MVAGGRQGRSVLIPINETNGGPPMDVNVSIRVMRFGQVSLETGKGVPPSGEQEAVVQQPLPVYGPPLTTAGAQVLIRLRGANGAEYAMPATTA